MKKFLFTGVLFLLGAAAMPLSAAPVGVTSRLGKIAFNRADTRAIYVINPDGSGTAPLRTVSRLRPISWYDPAWSPSGKRLALLGVFDDGTMDHDNRIYVRAPSGRARDIHWVELGTHGIAWSPNGNWLALDTGGDTPHLALLNVANGKTHVVVRGFYGIDPAWSPDGRWIFFLYGEGPNAAIEGVNWRGIAVVRPNGRGFSKLGIHGDNPSWSPDGKKIAFNRLDANGENHGISVMNRDGSHQTRLTSRAGDGDPAWSPTGSQIVFTRAGPRGRLDLWIMRRDGTRQSRLIASGYAASWQPLR